MRVFKILSSLCITLALIYLLDNRWVVGGTPIPPVGKFLDPYSGFWRNMEPADHDVPGTLDIRGLQSPVTVVYDSLSIPHIFASNDLDLYFAQGFITARYRLWQMEFQTHAAAGRISEITGAGNDNMFLQYDRGQRRLGMEYGAQEGLKALSQNQDALIMVEKYSEGINAFINGLDYASLPFEYKLLDYAPEQWTPLKCSLLQRNMMQTLSMSDKDIEMTNALKLFGLDIVQVLYPDREAVGDPVVDNPGGWKFTNDIPDSIPVALPQELINLKRLPGADPTIGSNNWAVSGSKTESGAPILCGDPHLDLSLPSLWFALQLNAPGINTLGVSLPGAPGVIIGCTDSIAWSITNAQRDLVDWYKITFQDGTRNKYLLDSQWVSTREVVEEFKVRETAPYYDTVIYTHWGPIPYDKSFRAQDNLNGYAFRWVGHDPTDGGLAFYKLNRAQNYTQFSEALDQFASPPSNFAFAAASGDIAMRVQGKYPKRRNLEGKFVLDGSISSNGWSGFIPTEQNIKDKNPSRGFVSSANQYPADATYPYYITANSFEAYRNRRINQVLAESTSIRVEDMMKLQTDNYNLKAAESLPYFLSLLDSEKLTVSEQEAFRILSDWNFVNTFDVEAASYYEAWWDNLVALIWDELNVPGVDLSRPTTFTTIRLLKETPGFEFFDILSTPEKEDARAIVQQAFSLAVSDIEQWKLANSNVKVGWGDYKASYISHLMRIPALSEQVLTGGNHDIVNAHTRTHGPSWRMIVSLEKSGAKMWGVYPGGQSGNPGSNHYVDMLDTWVQGKYFPIHFFRKADDAGEALDKTQLNPQKGI